MSNFLSLIKSRLESGTQIEPLGEPGWVRAVLAQASQPDVALDPTTASVAALASSSGRTGEELSRTFWEAGMLDSPIPDGFYSITPNEDMRSRFAAFPSLASLEAAPRGLSGDVLLVDRRQDLQLGRLAHLAHNVLQATKTYAAQEAQLQRLAEIVADFYGGAISEAISQRSSTTSTALEANNWRPRSDSAPAVVLLTELERGACRPRALLFKHLCDELGFHSRLIMGFQMEAVPLSPLAGVRPNEHLSVVVLLERGREVLVDLLKKPGLLRPVSPRSLLTYHVGHAGDTEAMEYESGDSGPNSPLYGMGLATDSPEHEILDSPRLRVHRQRMAAQQAQAAAAYGLTSSPDAKLTAGEVPPTRSIPNGLEDAGAPRAPWRFQGSPSPSEPGPRGRGQDMERHVLSSPEQRSQPHRRMRTSALEASSLPTSPEVSRDLRRRVHSEEGSLPSSPELSQRVHSASMLGSARRFLLDEGENGTLSPEAVYAHPPPFARRRSRKKSVDIDDSASHCSVTSPDRPPRVLTRVATHAGPWDLPAASAKWQGGSPAHAKGDDRRPSSGGSPAQSSASELARHLVRQRSSESAVPPRPQRTPSPSSADRRATRRSVPQVTDDVVRAVRAMNESLRAGRRRSDSVVKEPPSATGTASSTSGATPTANAAHTGGRPPTELQVHGGFGSAHRGEMPETERCPWCRRACLPGSPPPIAEESFLHRLDRLGIDYRPASALCRGVDCQPFPRPSSVRAFLRGASAEQIVPDFSGRHAPSSHPSSQLLPAPLSPQGPPVSGGPEGGVPGGSQAGTVAGRALRSASELASMLEQRQLLPFPEWHIDFAEIKLGIRVGVGSFGEVFRGIWRGTEVAVKLLLEQDLSPDNMDDFCNEISLLSRLRHPNVILFLGACIKAPHLSMVTEYMHMGSLYRLIHASGQGPRLSLRRRLKMLRDICRGMMCIQRMNIVHRDLKSANCLVDKHWAVKICDFGLSRLAADASQPGAAAVGTPEWMAPELLRSEAATYKCDVFSFGVIVWEMSTLRRPWEGLKPHQVVAAVATQRARLPAPPGVLGKLVADCFAESPASRPSWEECLARLHESEFLQDLDE